MPKSDFGHGVPNFCPFKEKPGGFVPNFSHFGHGVPKIGHGVPNWARSRPTTNLEHKASCVSKMFHSSNTSRSHPILDLGSDKRASAQFRITSDQYLIRQTINFLPRLGCRSGKLINFARMCISNPTQPEFARNDSL